MAPRTHEPLRKTTVHYNISTHEPLHKTHEALRLHKTHEALRKPTNHYINPRTNLNQHNPQAIAQTHEVLRKKTTNYYVNLQKPNPHTPNTITYPPNHCVNPWTIAQTTNQCENPRIIAKPHEPLPKHINNYVEAYFIFNKLILAPQNNRTTLPVYL